jgi:hypothetical protein
VVGTIVINSAARAAMLRARTPGYH